MEKEMDMIEAKSDETYIPLSRGLIEHLNKLSGNEAKQYIWLLLSAQFTGKDKGKVVTSERDISKALNFHRNTTRKLLKQLKHKGYIRFKPGSNQWKKTEIIIEKYKGVRDFVPIHRYKNGSTNNVPAQELTQHCTKIRPALHKNCASRFHNSNGDKEKQTPKNVIRMNKKEKKEDFTIKDKKLKKKIKDSVLTIN